LNYLVKDENYGKISIEEMCVNFEIFYKLKKQLIVQNQQRNLFDSLTKEKEKLLVSVFGKDKKLKLEQSLAHKKPE